MANRIQAVNIEFVYNGYIASIVFTSEKGVLPSRRMIAKSMEEMVDVINAAQQEVDELNALFVPQPNTITE